MSHSKKILKVGNYGTGDSNDIHDQSPVLEGQEGGGGGGEGQQAC